MSKAEHEYWKKLRVQYDTISSETIKGGGLSLPSERATEVVKDRQHEYGHPAIVYRRVAKIWSGILGIDVSEHQVALCLAGLKLGREATQPLEDNRTDLAGYANVMEMIRNYETNQLEEE